MLTDFYCIDGVVNPQPWSAPRPGSKGGKFAYMWSDPKLKAYKKALADEIKLRYPNAKKIPEAEDFSINFWFWRDTSGGNKCDKTNLVKATEDALQGILYEDDKHNVAGYSCIVEQGPGVTPKIIISVTSGEFRSWDAPIADMPKIDVAPNEDQKRRDTEMNFIDF